MTQIEKLKLMLDITNNSQDGKLQLLLDDVASDILTWTNRKILPVALESTQRQLAIIRFNMQGVEGQTSHNEGGVSRSFDDLPPSIKQPIIQHRLAKVVGMGAT
ncbi:phage head-tail connector protein [Paenibacillus sp. ACRRX]|uniref:phage head-tail connector protein n=1 Tax=Paenibacillus sp. ACRRX TaxID=2918206 RepID=UPI001EF4DBCD|nr:phage head-tail connector protein [Paenibacillus sp. ACRRX]MCG7406777.1 phage head-tail connector protein [Paenibacillus sp. ACRRX]